LGLAGWLDAVAGLVTVTEMTSPFAAVTVVVTVPSGAVVTVVVSLADELADELEDELDDELADAEEDEALVAGFKMLSALAALLLMAPIVIAGSPALCRQPGHGLVNKRYFAAGHSAARQAKLALLQKG
jgi:hypothetical protein